MSLHYRINGKACSLLMYLWIALIASSAAVSNEQNPANSKLHQLLNGNSIYGLYGELVFKQILHTDGRLTVAVKGGDPEILQAQWFINKAGKYCEQWPDHQACFDITEGEQDYLNVTALGKHSDITIKAQLYRGQIPLTFD
ncbi:hypothetical protein [Oceanicoccus sp. KOV_DT_Chl]|uniref:hypothetical protein n=1 Tax=Oceanicoccus sp. KOV_DT_Chl TaxID=1904639 RepID=UPI000C7A38C6|nr:hypothetical protein [Oceanicoccus sp. KOV_DT_Chl]